MSMNEIYQLIDKFEKSELSEIVLETDGMKFSAKKSYDNLTQNKDAQEKNKDTYEVLDVPERRKEFKNAKMTGKSDTAKQEENAITAPLVGTFYRAAAPGEAPFVTIGKQVKAGDVIGIIEAMKLMNEITATSDGVVDKILVEDGELVEFGKPLIQMV